MEILAVVAVVVVVLVLAKRKKKGMEGTTSRPKPSDNTQQK